MPAETILFSPNLASGVELGDIYPASAGNTKTTFSDIQNDNFDPLSIINSFAIALGIWRQIYSDSSLMMIATEPILREDWDTPEEDEAWADLLRVR